MNKKANIYTEAGEWEGYVDRPKMKNQNISYLNS